MSLDHPVLTADGHRVPLTVARATGAGAAVVIVPSAFGVAPDVRQQMAELSERATLVTTFDPFARTDPGPADYADMPRVMGRLRQLDFAQTYGDLQALIAWTRDQAPSTPLVVLGVCFGGPFALHAAADGLADALATWHATRLEAHLDLAPRVRVPADLHFGAVDPVVPPHAVDAIRAAFADHPAARVTVHPGATHGFTHRSAAAAYDPAAERAAMAGLVALVTRT